MKNLGKRYWIAIICKIVVILSTFLISIIINRGLGPSLKGDYAYIINYVELLYIFFSIGLGQAYATFKRRYGCKIKGTFVMLSLLHGLALIFIAIICRVIIKRFSEVVIILLLTGIAVIYSNYSMIAVIEDSIKRNIIIAIVNIIYLITLVIFYFLNTITLNSVLICYALNELINIFLFIKYYKLEINFHEIKKQVAANIYKVGFVTMIVILLISINYSMDTIMLKKMTSSYEVGIYSVAVTFSNMFLLIPDAFKEVIFGDSTDKNFSKKTAYNAIKVSIALSVVILIAFFLLGKFAINILYGEEYIPSYNITLILFVGSFSMIFFKILQPIYISHGKQNKAVVFLTGSAILNIILNYLLIPIYASIGAAVASAFSYTLCGLLFLIDYSRYGIDNNTVQKGVINENKKQSK